MSQTPLRLHLGCGDTMPDGWVNIDGSWNIRLAKHPILHRVLRTIRVIPPETRHDYKKTAVWHNLLKPLRYGESSVDAIYASHVLEHLHLEDAQRLLSDCYRVLKPGGAIRLVVPDLRSILLEYTGEFDFGPDDAYGVITDDVRRNRPLADRVNLRLLMHKPARPKTGLILSVYRALNDFHSHKWMYDTDSLRYHVEQAGFENVESRGLHDSRIESIKDVELPVRVLNGVGACVEGVKPGVP